MFFFLVQVSTSFQAAKIKVASKVQKLKYLSDDLFLVASFVRIFNERYIIVKWVGHIHCSQVPIKKLKEDVTMICFWSAWCQTMCRILYRFYLILASCGFSVTLLIFPKKTLCIPYTYHYFWWLQIATVLTVEVCFMLLYSQVLQYVLNICTF